MKKLILLLLYIPLVSFGQYDFIGSVERISNEIDDFISKDSKIEIIAKGFSWSEGPVWSKKLNAVLFSDVPNNVIVAGNPAKIIKENFSWSEGVYV